MAQIKTGTVSVTNGSNVVAGVGTTWLTDGVQAGDGFVIQSASGIDGAGVYYTVGGSVTETSLQLASNWAGDTDGGLAYVIVPDFIAPGYPLLLPGDLEAKPLINQNVQKLINDKASALVSTASGANQTVAGALDDRVVRVGSVAGLRALTTTGLSDNAGARITATGRAGDFYWDSSDLSAEVTADEYSGIYVAPEGQDGTNGAWVRDVQTALLSSWFDFDWTGGTDDTSRFNSVISNIVNDGDEFWFGPGAYLISGGLVDSKTGVVIKSVGTVELFHPVEGDTGRSVTQKNILFDSCSNCQIHWTNFKGQHTNDALGDNAVQSAVTFLDCTDCLAYHCYAEDHQRSFQTSGSTDCNFVFCKVKTCYNAFFATNSSARITWSNCESVDSYWAKQSEGSGGELASGYGFLVDNSTDCEANSCKSTRSGSDCYRSNGGSSNTKWINSKSYSPRRNSFSHRGTTTSPGCQTINCDAYKIGDIDFWTGAVDSYTEPAANARGHYIDADGVVVRGGRVENGLTSATSNMATVAWINGDECKMHDLVGVGYCSEAGIEVTNSAEAVSLSGNDIKIQVLTAEDVIYVYDIGSGENHDIKGNKATGGYDGYLVVGDKAQIVDNKSYSAARHGFNNLSEDSLHDGNISVNCGQVSSFGAGHHFGGINITCGTNIAIDRQGTPTMYRAAWINSSAAGIFLGQMVNRSSVTDLRDDLTLGDRASLVSGKGVTATDIGTLLTSLRDAELIES